MQEGDIADPAGGGERGIALVPGTADGVEALTPALQLTRDAIELAAEDLRLEHADQLGRR
jgi:hypothetical protein